MTEYPYFAKVMGRSDSGFAVVKTLQGDNAHDLYRAARSRARHEMRTSGVMSMFSMHRLVDAPEGVPYYGMRLSFLAMDAVSPAFKV